MTFRVYIAALRYSNFLFEGDVERLMPHLERAMEILPQFGEVGQGKTCSRTQSRSLPTPALMRMTSWLCLESLLDRQSCNVQHCNSMQQHYVETEGMKTVLNGPTMWPADGNHLVGPAPEWDVAPNFWLACAEPGAWETRADNAGHIHIRIHVQMCICICIHLHMRIHIHMRTHTCIHTHIHA